MSETPFKTWMCQMCGHIYDEAAGDPDSGIPPGTRWADVPDDWVCPMCRTPKNEFEMVEM